MARVGPPARMLSCLTSRSSLGGEMFALGTSLASRATGVTKQAIYIPVYMEASGVALKLWWANGGTVSGNVDIGLYAADGTKLVTAGLTAQATINVIQEVDIADLPLAGSSMYYLALYLDNTTGTFIGAAPGLHFVRAMGVMMQSGINNLPTTSATFAQNNQNNVPLCGIAFRTLAA